MLARDKISEEAFDRISSYLLSPEKFRELIEKEQKDKCNGIYYEVDSGNTKNEEGFRMAEKELQGHIKAGMGQTQKKREFNRML